MKPLIILITLILAAHSYANKDNEFFVESQNYESNAIEKYGEEIKELQHKAQKLPKYRKTIEKLNEAASLNQYNGKMPDLISDVDHKKLSKIPNEPQGQLKIFISSSVPKKSLKNLASEVRNVGGVLVLRGFINNSFKESVNFIKELHSQGVSAIVDPHSFKLYDITQVPSFVLISDNNKCHPKICTPLHDKISGNINLKYALEQIKERGSFSKDAAKKYLNRYRKW